MKSLRMKSKWLWIAALAGGLGFAMPVQKAAADVVIHIGGGAPLPTPVVYHYQYYPEAEVYFVPETKVYWWSTGGTWVSGPQFPQGTVLGSVVRLDVDAQEPWHHHEIIVKQHPRRGHGKEKNEEKREEKREEKHK